MSSETHHDPAREHSFKLRYHKRQGLAARTPLSQAPKARR